MGKVIGSFVFLSLVACASATKSSESNVIIATAIEEKSISEALVAAELEIEEEPQGAAVEPMPAPEQEPAKKVKKQLHFKYEMIPSHPNRITRKWIEYYTVKDRQRFQRFLNNGQKYKTVIQQLLVDHGLPPDLYYLGILESGFKTHAVSRVGAVGTWQFMRPTGREYGLAINHYVDERLDPMRSTVAAIRYLKELYRQFRSWEMALAAYNAGPGRVRRAARRGGTNNYWRLSERRFLPKDTRHYVPQFLAILIVGSNPSQYGFSVNPENALPPIRLVNVPSPVKLTDVAKVTNVPLAKLKRINPHLIRGVTPPNVRSYDVWVPQKSVVQAIAKKHALKDKIAKDLPRPRYVAKSKKKRSRSRLVARKPQGKSLRYRIRRGDNLTKIAKRFNTTVGKLKKINKLRGNSIQKGQYLKIADNRN